MWCGLLWFRLEGPSMELLERLSRTRHPTNGQRKLPVGCDSTCIACIPSKPCFSVRGHAWTSHVSTARHWIKSRPHFFSQAILKEWDLKLEMNYLTISDYKIHEDPSFVHHPILSGCFGAQGHRTNTIQLMQLQLQLNAVATIENKPYSKSSVDHP